MTNKKQHGNIYKLTRKRKPSKKKFEKTSKKLKKFLTNDSGCDKLNELSLDREKRRTLITKQ